MDLRVVLNLLAYISVSVIVSIPYVIIGRMHVLNTLLYIGIFLSLSTSLNLPAATQLMRIILVISAVLFCLPSLIMVLKIYVLRLFLFCFYFNYDILMCHHFCFVQVFLQTDFTGFSFKFFYRPEQLLLMSTMSPANLRWFRTHLLRRELTVLERSFLLVWLPFYVLFCLLLLPLQRWFAWLRCHICVLRLFYIWNQSSRY